MHILSQGFHTLLFCADLTYAFFLLEHDLDLLFKGMQTVDVYQIDF